MNYSSGSNRAEYLRDLKAKIAKIVCQDGETHDIMINTKGKVIIDGRVSTKYKVRTNPPANKKR